MYCVRGKWASGKWAGQKVVCHVFEFDNFFKMKICDACKGPLEAVKVE